MFFCQDLLVYSHAIVLLMSYLAFSGSVQFYLGIFPSLHMSDWYLPANCVPSSPCKHTPTSVEAHWPRNLNSSLPFKEAGWSPLTSFILQSHKLFLEVKIKTHPVPWGSTAFCPELQNAQRDILGSSTYIL